MKLIFVNGLGIINITNRQFEPYKPSVRVVLTVLFRRNVSLLFYPTQRSGVKTPCHGENISIRFVACAPSLLDVKRDQVLT